MNNELDTLLCERYLLIFADRNGDITRSGMPFGFECGDGWFSLIDALCERLQFSTDHDGSPQVVASQVKEKWGALCFYVHSASEEQWGMIRMAEAMSGRICEECGQHGQVLVNGSVFLTRCQPGARAGQSHHACRVSDAP